MRSVIIQIALHIILHSVINHTALHIILCGIISHATLYITLRSLHSGYGKATEVDSRNLTVSTGLHLQNTLRCPVIEGTYDVGLSVAEMVGNL